MGPCCTSGCTLRNGDKCRDDNGCRGASFCDGRGPQCPPSINKPNKTICNEEFVCYMGECTGSICLAYGLESCQCIAGPEDPPTKSCELCCKLPGEDQPCLSSFAWNSAPYDIPDMLSKPGTPCNDYNGYCDVFQRCREVDPSGPLATLRRLLLSHASLASFQRWLADRWYAVAFAVLVLLSILVVITRLLSKRRNNRSKVVPTQEDSSSQDTRNPTTTDESSSRDLAGSVRKIQSMNISRIKKRLVETMKSIASPRRKRDDSSEEASFLIGIWRLFGKDSSGRPGKCNMNEVEQLYTANEASKRHGKEDCSHVVGGQRDSTKDPKKGWKRISWFFLENRGACSATPRRKLTNGGSMRGSSWRRSREVENLCGTSKTIAPNPCKRSEGYQKEPLVEPETPETPSDLSSEPRLQTSDLTVLLPES